MNKPATEKQLKYAQSLIKQFKRAYFGGGEKYIWGFVEEYELRIKNGEQLPMKYVSLFIEQVKSAL